MSTVQQSFEFFVDVPRRKMTIQEHFEAFRTANPWFIHEFIRIALELRAEGFERYSADGIGHVIRFKIAMKTKSDDGRRLNNNHVAGFARLAMQMEPRLQGFFETRERRAA